MNNFEAYDSMYGKWIVNTSQPGYQQHVLDQSLQSSLNSEVQHMFKIIDTLPDNAVVMDGGTNIGTITVPIAIRLKHTNARILSVEAQRRIFYALAGTVALNDLYNVFLYNLALGETRGVVNMPDVNYGQTQDFGSVSVTGTADTIDYLNYNTVSMTNIDSFDLPRLDFLKLDIEGYEPGALRGGLETIRKYRPWMWIEYYDCVSTYNQHEIKSILEPLGDYSFHYLAVDGQNMLCIPNEKRKGVNLDFIGNPV
jgi:FkbM family methyltransferase